jgi:phosphate starvation-inducible membrane PsiE
LPSFVIAAALILLASVGSITDSLMHHQPISVMAVVGVIIIFVCALWVKRL